MGGSEAPFCYARSIGRSWFFFKRHSHQCARDMRMPDMNFVGPDAKQLRNPRTPATPRLSLSHISH